MRRIFIGMIFVFLNFNLDIGSSRIGLIPTFVGYIFMLKGVSELSGFSKRFISVKKFIVIMVVYSIIFYIADIFGASMGIGAGSLILGLISTIISLIVSYNIVKGIEDIEQARMQDLNSGELYIAWKLLAILSLAVYPLMLVPVLAIVGMIMGFVVGVYYLIVFNNTKNLFYNKA